MYYEKIRICGAAEHTRLKTVNRDKLRVVLAIDVVKDKNTLCPVRILYISTTWVYLSKVCAESLTLVSYSYLDY